MMKFTRSDYGYYARSAESDALGFTVRSYYIDRPDTIQPTAVRKFWSVRIFRYDVAAADEQVHGEFRTKKEAVAFVESFEFWSAQGADHYYAKRDAFNAAMDVRYPEFVEAD